MEDIEYDWGPIDDVEEELDYDLDDEWTVPVPEEPPAPEADAAPTEPVQGAAVGHPEAQEPPSEARALEPQPVDLSSASGQSRDLPKQEVLPKPVQELAPHDGATNAPAASSGKPAQAKSNEVDRAPSTSKPAKESRARIPIPTPAPSALPYASTDGKPKTATALKPSAKFVSSPESKPLPKTETQGGFNPVSTETSKGAGRHEQGKGRKRGPDAKAETKEGPRPLKRNGAIDRPPTKLLGPRGPDTKQGGIPPRGLPMPPGFGRGNAMQPGGMRPNVPGPRPPLGAPGQVTLPGRVAPSGSNKPSGRPTPGPLLAPGNFTALGPHMPYAPKGPSGGPVLGAGHLQPGPLPGLAGAPLRPSGQQRPPFVPPVSPQRMVTFDNNLPRMPRPLHANPQMVTGQAGSRPLIGGGFPAGNAFPQQNQGQPGNPDSGSGMIMGRLAQHGAGAGPSCLPMPGQGMRPAQQDAHRAPADPWGKQNLMLPKSQGLHTGPGAKPLSVPVLAGDLGYGMDPIARRQDAGSRGFAGREQDGGRNHINPQLPQGLPMRGAYGANAMQGSNMIGSHAMNLEPVQQRFQGTNGAMENNRRTVTAAQAGPSFRGQEGGGLPLPGGALPAMSTRGESGPVNGKATTEPASIGPSQASQEETLRRRQEAELRIQIQRQENLILAKERDAKIREMKEAKAKAAASAAAPASSTAPPGTLEQMQAQIMALSQMVAGMVRQPEKAAAEVAPRDAPESAAKPQPTNVSPVEVAAARPTGARVPVRETAKSRPAADPADDDEEPILQQKRVIRKRPSPEGPVRRSALASSERTAPSASRPRSVVVEPANADSSRAGKKRDKGRKRSAEKFLEDEEADEWGSGPVEWEEPDTDLRAMLNRRRGTMEADREQRPRAVRARPNFEQVYKPRGAR